MDSISEVKFEFELTITDVSSLKEPHQLLLGIVGNFKILVGNNVLYDEVEFPLIEFAWSLTRWLNHGLLANRDFTYESLESEEIGLVWIKFVGNGWRIGSIHQNYDEMRVFSNIEIRRVADDFLNRFEQELLNRFGLYLNLQTEVLTGLFSCGRR